MDALTMIGGILLILGLLIFTIKLLAYNRKKYPQDKTVPVSTLSVYRSGNSTIRFLALAILLIALVILFLFKR